MTTAQPRWLTKEAHARLRAELDDLLARRTESEGEEEAQRRARIREIQELLRDAVVGEAPPDDGIAEPGMVLTVRFEDGDTETFLLGARGGADDDLDVYSPESPLGAALSGAKQGERRTYAVPNGGTAEVTLVRAVPYGQHRR
ncbi:Transcription elongation factor, GreA/GreB family [Saccharopolyspora kobensis]|uniref:GreA/GreB family elongation factor n=1 Tax=Saccharopolyspora kobensis TaxID=146035 RepID=A0A1H6EGM6_9PSEU|nr:GreA/GreB family elongation factor [Saccharopolyspora kobensis]SEG96967.1 Transcription elongation factor, GreA/GreB family [Saccharopolyspora kobensis]SFE65147.1 GreA/GreB family elongation factor [Saccharopolyspora kobensis]